MKHLTIGNFPKPPYYVEEAVNRLRLNIGFCGDEIKKIMIISSLPNEGKSFVSMNLWRAIAETGAKVVLVDTDMRNSVMRGHYQMHTDDVLVGLPHYLSGQCALDDVIYHTDIENGDLITVPAAVSNCAILLENPRFERMLDELAKRYDYVLLDTLPLENVADGARIASVCDGSVLVVRSGTTPRAIVGNSIAQIERTGCPLLGVVLNRADSETGGYYYYKYGYGKYSYGKKYAGYGQYGGYGKEQR